ncbi:MAG TPA: MFS transporter [Methylomirabilota bacterium]|jgi:MFS family permease|nr:MFS transporter [Methylomirabilota bacterium]
MIARLVPIGLITLAFNLGGGLAAPALPLYARTLGADYRDLGLIGAAHGLAFALLTIPLGRASDRFGRRAILLLSAIGVGGSAALYLAAGHVAGLAAGKLLEAAAWAAFWPTLEAWVAERFGARAGAAMGVAYGAYAAAFVVGSSIGGFVIEAFGLRAPFALYLGAAVLSVVLVALLAGGETADPETARHGRAVTPRIVTTHPARARRRRALAYLTGFVYVYGLGTVLAFLPAYGADRALSPRGVGLLLGAYWIARVIGSLGAGRVSDTLGRRLVLVPAMLGTVIGAGLVAAPLGAWALFLGVVALGLAAGASAPTCVGLIADHVSAEDRGTAMGLFEAACGVSILASGLVGGYAAEAFGGEAPYVTVGALALVWAGVLARALRSADRV